MTPINNYTPTLRDIRSNREKSKLIQIALVITAIATTLILSLAGVISSSYVLAAKIVLLSVPIAVIISCIIRRIVGAKKGAEDTYLPDLLKANPVSPMFLSPIAEEMVFRLGIQGGLHCLLKKIIPQISITLLGLPFTLAGIISIVVAGALFGAVHAGNDHKSARSQAIVAGLMGVFVEGRLFYFHGLHASIFAHVFNNSVLLLPLTFCHDDKKHDSRRETTTHAPTPQLRIS